MFDFLHSKKIKEIDKSVSRSFSQVRKDTDSLTQWVTYLYDQHRLMQDKLSVQQRLIDTQRVAINELRVAIRHMPRTAAEIRGVIDSYYSMDPILKRIKHIEDKISMLELRKPQQPHNNIPTTVVHYKEPKTSSALQEKLMKRIVKNSKDYIKKSILNLVDKYGRMTALQLREIIVEEQGLCSKSSFYRIIDEMEGERSLAEVSEGKTKVFVPITQ